MPPPKRARFTNGNTVPHNSFSYSKMSDSDSPYQGECATTQSALMQQTCMSSCGAIPLDSRSFGWLRHAVHNTSAQRQKVPLITLTIAGALLGGRGHADVQEVLLHVRPGARVAEVDEVVPTAGRGRNPQSTSQNLESIPYPPPPMFNIGGLLSGVVHQI